MKYRSMNCIAPITAAILAFAGATVPAPAQQTQIPVPPIQTELGTIARNTDGTWAFRNTRFFPAYPRYDWGLLGGWAWGISRCIDYLEGQSFADKSR